MKIPINHSAGQHRAELFEQVTEIILRRIYEGRPITRHFILPREQGGKPIGPISIDFIVETSKQNITVIETKAPYTETPSYGINKTLRRLKQFYQNFPDKERIQDVILALAAELPHQSAEEAERTSKFFAQQSVKCDIWDSHKIRGLLNKYCNISVATLTVESLIQVISRLSVGEKTSIGVSDEKVPSLDIYSQIPLPKGEQKSVIVIYADYCSFSRFVLASGSEGEIMRSIMGRFYRETRRIIHANSGLLDKFLGDGVLFYWMEPHDSKKIDGCIRELIGLSLNLAEEWQELVDLNVTPKGMRVGAAIGTISFIPETDKATSPVHAIGECINLAARLQAVATPNSLLISNKLHTAEFGDDKDFLEIGPTELKNIGEVLAWKKDYRRLT